MYRGQKKHDFLDFLANKYETQANNNVAGHFVRNKERDIAVIALMLGTGVRVQEATSANVNDLNIQSSMLNVVRKGSQKDTEPINDARYLTTGYVRKGSQKDTEPIAC